MTSKEKYAAYLRSPEWKALRDSTIARDGGRCRVCNAGNDLVAHHRTYARAMAEAPDDLTTLCRRCHDAVHKDRKVVGRLNACSGRTCEQLMARAEERKNDDAELAARRDEAVDRCSAIFEELKAQRKRRR